MSTNPTGPRNGNWRGGRTVASNGYVLLRVGVGQPLADVRGYAYEHRVVASNKIGRPLVKGEHVHHINGDKTDNRPENLEVLTHTLHRAAHRTESSQLRPVDTPNPMVSCECGCGATFRRYDDAGRPRRFAPGHAAHDDPGLAFARSALADGPRSLAVLAARYPAGLSALRTMFGRLAERGDIVRVSRGVYGLRGSAVRQPPNNAPVGCACGCGRQITPFDEYGRSRRFVSGHNRTGTRRSRS